MKALKLGLAALIGLSASCATIKTSNSQATPQKMMQANTEPQKTAPEKPQDTKENPQAPEPEAEMDAGKLLGIALTSLDLKEYKFAAEMLNRAIATGNLNDAGRCLAYWHLGVSYLNLGEKDQQYEALSSFLQAADDVLEQRATKRFATNDKGEDFVSNFQLEDRIMRASATLNSEWAKRSDYFGRSEMFPVPIRGLEEITYFIFIVIGMVQDCNSRLQPRTENESIYRVVTECNSGKQEEFYFYLRQQGNL